MTQTKVTDAMRDTTSLDVSDLSGAVPAAKGGTGVTAVGTSGNVLTSTGSAWASTAPAGGGLSSFRATGSDSHALTNGAWTLMQMGTEVHDDESQYDHSASNFKWTPSSGRVLIGGQVSTNGGPTDTKHLDVAIYKNGSHAVQETVFWQSGTAAGFEGYSIVGFFEANGSDYFQLYAYHNKGSNFNTYAGNNTFWGIQIS